MNNPEKGESGILRNMVQLNLRIASNSVVEDSQNQSTPRSSKYSEGISRLSVMKNLSQPIFKVENIPSRTATMPDVSMSYDGSSD
jgi:hypothetical protein